MSSWVLHSRQARGDAGRLSAVSDPEILGAHLQDAAHYPGGHATTLYAPDSEAAVAEILRRHEAVLPLGAQSSLTGGATPMGDVLLSTSRLTRILSVDRQSICAQAGVTLAALDEASSAVGGYYPPVPTFLGACIGGVVSTNAAGAATFKYGTTRNWIEALTVVLADGDVLDLERGQTRAHADGYFELELTRGVVRVPVPSYRMPPVAKLSAGYYAAPGMDLIDLFIGAEGTLGVVTEVTLRLLPARPGFCLALVPFDDRATALTFAARLRESSIETRRTADPCGLDACAIEHMDGRCLALLHEDGADRMNGVALQPDAAIALLVTLEVPGETTAQAAFEQIGSWADRHGPDTPLTRFCALLGEYRAMDGVQLAVPGDRARAQQLMNLREAVPAGVNRRVGLARQQVDVRIEKTAGDLIVPFERLQAMIDFYDSEFRRRGLDGAVWGHISDGNLHPNVIPRSLADVESGKEAILAFGREAIRLEGAPLAEHGVGRNSTKQQLLAELYGQSGIDEMRRVKAAVDPAWKLAPGVLFSK